MSIRVMMVDDEPLIRKIVKMEMNGRAARIEAGDLDSTVLSQVEMVDTFGDGGSLLRLVGVLAVWLTGQVLDGYLITPKIQGEKTGLGYAGVIFSFFFWGVVFHSMLGLLLAIPLSAFCVVLWRALKERYIKGVI